MKLSGVLLSLLIFTFTFISCEKQKIKACFTIDGNKFFVNESITFNLNCSENPSTSIRWDFGDGSIDESRDIEITHTYIKSGEYHVTLTICEHAMWYKLDTRCDEATQIISIGP